MNPPGGITDFADGVIAIEITEVAAIARACIDEKNISRLQSPVGWASDNAGVSASARPDGGVGCFIRPAQEVVRLDL